MTLIYAIRFITERAYLNCWGERGTADDRDRFNDALHAINLILRVGYINYDSSCFHWTDKRN